MSPQLWPTLVPCILPANILDALEAGPGTYASSPVGVRCFAPGEKVILGAYCSLGCDVQLMTGGNHATGRASTFNFHARKNSNNFQAQDPFAREPDYTPPKTTTIGNDVWIGDGAVIGGGSQIGDGAVIGAYSVVMNKDIPPYAVVVGNPGRVVRYRFGERVVSALRRVQWWKWSEEKILAELPSFYDSVEAFVSRHDLTFATSDATDDLPEGPCCTKAPPGWNCTRAKGHTGSCAAWPMGETP